MKSRYRAEARSLLSQGYYSPSAVTMVETFSRIMAV